MADIRGLPLTSSHWGTYRVEAAGGRVKGLHGFEHDPDSSPIGHGIVDVLDGPTRITAPMVRESWLMHGYQAGGAKRGAEAFVEVSWEVAEQLVADEIDRVREQHGNRAIFAGSYGWASAGRFHHAQSQLHRFFNCIGGYTRAVNTYSFAAAEVVVPHVLGSFREYLATATSWPSIIESTELFVAFGGIPLKNGQINSGGVGAHGQRDAILAAHQAGVHFVNVGPLRSDMVDAVEGEWLAPRPSTDTAILLGLAHTLCSEGLHDSDFLARYCVGYAQFESYLLGQADGVQKDAQWAAAISGLQADTIRNLARRMAAKRTMLSVSWSLTRQDHGEQTFWAAITVAAMLGQIGLPGGGVGFGYSAINSIGMHAAAVPGAALPQGENPVSEFIPVARIADMLLHPGAPFDYDGGHYTYPDTRMVYWAGGNPFHHHQDLNRLLRAWRKPETVIVHEWCWNALAKNADIVLPCTTTLERNDVAISPRDPYVVMMEKVAEPAGQSRNDFDIFSGIAAKLNRKEQFTDGRSDDEWLQWIYTQTRDRSAKAGVDLPDFNDFRTQRWFKFDEPRNATVMLAAFRRDPAAFALKTPSGAIEIFSQTIAGFGYDDCFGHAAWFEPIEWLGNARDSHPLHMISNQPSTKLHSQLDHGSHSRASKINEREPVTLHPDDARSRDISNGDVVRIFNSRGACLAGAIVSDEIRPGVIQISTGAWFDPQTPGAPDSLCKHGNPNVLTIDKGTSRLSQGPIAHTCLVQVERYQDELPPLTAFSPPTIKAAADALEI